tara:strand:- start:374 stop:580 length:207 start_codon:yes stop_codon:yes gene_type:complete
LNAFQLNQVVKTQRIRLIDVFVLGPLMVYASTVIPKRHATTKAAMAVFGVSTIVYNWRNYQKVQNRLP